MSDGTSAVKRDAEKKEGYVSGEQGDTLRKKVERESFLKEREKCVSKHRAFRGSPVQGLLEIKGTHRPS
jgi:hypothetical protein